MNANKKTSSTGAIFKFILFSLFGIYMFFVPVSLANGGTTIPVEVVTTFLVEVIPALGPIYALAVMAVASFLPFVKKTWNKDALSIAFSISKVLGLIIGIMVYTGFAPEAVMRSDHGPFLFNSLAIKVGMLLPVAAIFLTFLMDYGFVDFIGLLLRKIMRIVFNTPGYSAVDAVASFMGSTASGIMITGQMYETRRYNAREAAIVATGFSTVCVSFFVVVANTANIMHLWTPFFFITFITTFVITAITARIPPLSRKPDSYYQDMPKAEEPEIEGSLIAGAWNEAIKVCSNAGGLLENILRNLKNSFYMVFEVVPNFMSIGLIALILADYTPVFDWLGYILYPLTALLQVPEPLIAAKAAMLGLAQMYLPVLVIGEASEITRFIVASISITQVLMFTTTVPCILATKIPVSIKDMVIVWFERTILSFIILVPLTFLAI